MTVEAPLFLGGGGEEGESADTLAVEALLGLVSGCRGRDERGANHVLGEGLTKRDLVTLFDKVTDSVGVLVRIAGCEPLVCHIEKRKVAAILDGVRDGPPLLGGWINTSRVVCARVEEEDAALRGILNIRNESLDVKSDCLFVVVPILLYVQSGVLKDRSVVGPRWGGDVNSLGMRVKALKEGAADTKCTSAGDGLGDSNVVEDRGGGTVGKGCCSLGEGGYTGNASVLLVEPFEDETLLGGADRGEDIGLASVVAVGTNSEVDFIDEGVGFEGFGDT